MDSEKALDVTLTLAKLLTSSHHTHRAKLESLDSKQPRGAELLGLNLNNHTNCLYN